ncbi:MAG: hypothetical protein GY780_00915 [bacterium]|nr:hypothetical protein [bacterium]
MKTHASIITVLIGIVLLCSTPASSAIISISLEIPFTDIGVPLANSIVGVVFEYVTGSVKNTRESPWIGTANTEGIYTAVLSDSMARYILSSPTNTFTLLWGSVDSHNIVQFYMNGVATGELIVGQDAIDAGAPEATGFGVATITTNSQFDEVRFLSTNSTFEFGNLGF